MTKKTTSRYSKYVFLTTLVVILVLSLSSCGLFQSRKDISSVSISVVSGLVDENHDGVYELECGKEFSLSVDWHNSLTNKPSIKWYVSIGNKEKKEIEGNSNKVLTYCISNYSNDIYTFSASVNGIESLSFGNSSSTEFAFIKIRLKYSTLKSTNVSILSTNYPIVQNVVQIDLNKTNIHNVDLEASYNKTAINPSWVIDTTWYVDNEPIKLEKISLDISKYKTEQTITIKVELSCQQDEDKASSIIYVDFVKQYLQVENVNVSNIDNNFSNLKGVTYYKEGIEECYIQLEAKVLPSTGTNLSNDCVWTRTASNGTEIIDIKTRNASIPLKYGKNTIKATIDNVESRQIIIYVLSDVDFKNRKYAIENTFIWEGSQQDYYINNQEELNNIFGYAASLHKTLSNSESLDDPNAVSFYLSPSEWREDLDKFKKALSSAATIGLDESGTFSYVFTSTKLGFTNNSSFGVPSGACQNSWNVVQENIANGLNESIQDRILPVDKYIETLTVTNSNELYRAVSNGYKPVISNETLQNLYDKARLVLNTYVKDSMSDLEKVRTIYEWLVIKVDYDKSTLESASADRSSFNAFYLEGVFNDFRAVCDGKSKAFALLCGMEGIKAERIIGYANESLGNAIAVWEGSGATKENIRASLAKSNWGHAWNKVLIDANNDGVKEWYIVDTTWGDISIIKEGKKCTEYLTYDYFLITDKDVERTHYSEQIQPLCDTAFNAYLNTYIDYDGENISLNLTSTIQANKLIEFSNLNDNVKIVVIDANNIFKTTNVLLDLRASWVVLDNSKSTIIWCA